MNQNISVNSLVVYKKRPARILGTGERLEIELSSGERVRVRLKDVLLIHPGPLHSLGELRHPSGDVATAWEILLEEEGRHTLAQLAELAYGHYSPASAWAAWELLEDGFYFSGTPDDLDARSPAAVEAERQRRLRIATEAQSWAAFLLRARQNQVNPAEDQAYIREIVDLAYGHTSNSRALRELGHAERPETAHAWLLEHDIWTPAVDPHPVRLSLPLSQPDIPLLALLPEQRRDLTGLPAFAIDDQGNQDPDDAISLEDERIWVHIADAAALITADNAADREARARGATLYLPEGAVPMLPSEAVRRLGLGLDEISPALSFGIELSPGGEIESFEFTPSWVKVQRLNYDQVEQMLDQEPFHSLNRLAQRYRSRRQANGAIEIDLPEVILRLQEEQVTIRPVLPLASRALVKEAMLMAGEAAARFALQNGLPFAFTNQQAPDPVSLKDLLASRPGARAEGEPDLALAFALRRAQKRSITSSQPGAHSGLGLPIYARITSPLRRYPDLLAHQQLRLYLDGAAPLSEAQLIERLGESEAVSSSLSRAEFLARKHWTLVYLMNHPGWRGSGVLVEKSGSRGKLILPELALEVQVQINADPPLNSRLPLSLRGVNLPELEAYF